MDIAGRAFRFWQYQHSEEAGFQAMLLRDVQEKLAVVENKHQGQARECEGFRFGSLCTDATR